MNHLEVKIQHKTRKITWLQALKGCLSVLLVLAGLCYVYLLASFFLPQLPTWFLDVRYLVSILVGVPICVALWTLIRWRRDVRRLTFEIESHYPHLRDRLSTVMEITGKDGRKNLNNPVSLALAKGLEDEMDSLLDKVQFGKASSLAKLKIPALVLVIFFLIFVVHSWAQPEFFNVALRKPELQWNFLEEAKVPHLPKFKIHVVPGDCEITLGSNLMIQAEIEGYDPSKVMLHTKKQGEGTWRVFPMEAMGQNRFQYLLTHISQATNYQIRVEGRRSAEYKIRLYDSLSLEQVVWRKEYPDYIEVAEESHQGWVPKITVPEGTKLHLMLELNRPVKPGWLLMEEERKFELQVVEPKVVQTSFEVTQDLFLDLDLRGTNGDLLIGTSSVWIQVIPDLPPYLEILSPLQQGYVFPTEEIPFEVNVDDDFGIQSVELIMHYQGREEKVQWVSDKERGLEKLELKKVLQLEKYFVESRDLITAYVEVRDNHPDQSEDSAHVVRSALFTFLIRDYVEQYKVDPPDPLFPSPRELFEDVLIDQEKVVKDMWDYFSQPDPESMTLPWASNQHSGGNHEA